MADAVISILLENLASLIKEEVVLLLGVKNEMEKLSSTFSTIQAVLADAEEKQYKEKAIKNWLRKLNTVSLEVDDILDDCATEASKSDKPLLKPIKKSGISRILGCFSQPRPELNLAFRHTIGQRMKEINEKLDYISKQRINLHLSDRPAADQSRADAYRRSRETSSLVTEPHVYGRDDDKEKIVDILVQQFSECPDVSVLPITGMGGLGKTTLAQTVFSDDRVMKHFEMRLWICVSEDFDVKRLIKEIIESIQRGKSPYVSNINVLQECLRELLNEKRYLLVLDDVWNEDQEKWEQLKSVLANGSRGASIIITTRIRVVAEIMGTIHAHCLSPLSEDDCWSLFSQRAFVQGTEERPNLVPIGKDIVKKCGDLPLAAKALGGLLRFKVQEHQWISVRDSDIWNLPQDKNSILPALRLSYYHLPTDLRSCFAYCAIFQKDNRISKRKVIRFWIAHGFIPSDSRREVEDIADEVWNELLIRSFFQDIEDDGDGDVIFKMHDLVHDLAQSIIVDKHEVGISNNSIIRHGCLVERRGTYNDTFPGLIILDGTDLSHKFKEFNSLRVLDASICGLRELPSTVGMLKHLRSLDLSVCYNLQRLPDEIGDLYNLQNLNLYNCSKLLELPDTVCNLQNLMVLDLTSCRSLLRLPKHMSNLRKLRHLHLDGCDDITQMPPDLGKLTCLRILSYYIVGETDGCKIKDLGTLNHLRRRLEIKHLERVENPEDAIEANLAAKKNLRRLELYWDTDSHQPSPQQLINMSAVLEALIFPSNLEYFKLSGYGGTVFPSWMSSTQIMQNVTEIFLFDCGHCKHLPLFGELPRLRKLKLNNIYMVEYIDDGGHSTSGDGGGAMNVRKFQSLEELSIGSLPVLKGFFPWRDDEEGTIHMPRLRELSIYKCPGLTSLAGVRSLKSLEILNAYDNNISLSAEGLPSSLESIAIKGVECLPSSLACLTALKRLEIQICLSMTSLPEWLEGLASLESLKISYFQNLESLPACLERMTNLQELTIEGCPQLEKRCEKENGEDWHKISHIPKVVFPRWY